MAIFLLIPPFVFLSQYAPTALDDSCIACGPGFATGVSTGALTCSDCGPGYYSNGESVDCLDCVAGRASGTRAASCTLCETGSYADAPTASFCQVISVISLEDIPDSIGEYFMCNGSNDSFVLLFFLLGMRRRHFH